MLRIEIGGHLEASHSLPWNPDRTVSGHRSGCCHRHPPGRRPHHHRASALLGNLRYGGGAVWVGLQSANRVFRIDTRSGRMSSVRVGSGPRSLAVSPTAVWVSNAVDGTVTRIDPATRQVVSTITIGGHPE